MHQGIFLSVRTGSYNAIKHVSYIKNGRKSLRVTVLGTGWDFFIEYGGFEGGGVGVILLQRISKCASETDDQARLL